MCLNHDMSVLQFRAKPWDVMYRPQWIPGKIQHPRIFRKTTNKHGADHWLWCCLSADTAMKRKHGYFNYLPVFTLKFRLTAILTAVTSVYKTHNARTTHVHRFTLRSDFSRICGKFGGFFLGLNKIQEWFRSLVLVMRMNHKKYKKVPAWGQVVLCCRTDGTDLVVSDPNSSVRGSRCFDTKPAADRDNGLLQLTDVPTNTLTNQIRH